MLVHSLVVLWDPQGIGGGMGCLLVTSLSVTATERLWPVSSDTTVASFSCDWGMWPQLPMPKLLQGNWKPFYMGLS